MLWGLLREEVGCVAKGGGDILVGFVPDIRYEGALNEAVEECVWGTGTAVVTGEGVCSRASVGCSGVDQVKDSQEAVDGVGGRVFPY